MLNKLRNYLRDYVSNLYFPSEKLQMENAGTPEERARFIQGLDDFHEEAERIYHGSQFFRNNRL